MKFKLILMIHLFLYSLVSLALVTKPTLVTGNITQSIQIINLLANINLSDPGMTPTSVIIKYYNGGSNPCWASALNYQEDTTVHAGPWLGCIEKINEIVIDPVLVANKLKTYENQLRVSINGDKYSHQLTIMQEQPPTFDIKTGLVARPGTMLVKIISN